LSCRPATVPFCALDSCKLAATACSRHMVPDISAFFGCACR
jgi:hypothetical protein